MGKNQKFFASNVVCAYLLSLSFQNKNVHQYTGCRIESQISKGSGPWAVGGEKQLKEQTGVTFLYCLTQT